MGSSKIVLCYHCNNKFTFAKTSLNLHLFFSYIYISNYFSTKFEIKLFCMTKLQALCN